MKNPQSPVPNRQSSLPPLDYAYLLLARRGYSEQELTARLCDKGFSPGVVSRAIERLKTQGYLDDSRLAADQVERLRARGFGPAGIHAKLTQKCLSADIIEAVLAAGEESLDLVSAQRLLASRFSADALKHPQTRARAFRLLLRRGYSQDLAERLLGSHPDEP
jgi:regulatory protein